MVKTFITFVDGENLVFRYQEMLASGRQPNSKVLHEPGAFVWSPQITLWKRMDVLRVNYYTSVVGSDEKVAAVEEKVGSTHFQRQVSDAGVTGTSKVIPRVHKKAAASRKTKAVDVDITLDVMRASLDSSVGGIFLLSGDGDYLPLIREVSRHSSKLIYLGAFSSGLAGSLRNNVESFLDLDNIFFI